MDKPKAKDKEKLNHDMSVMCSKCAFFQPIRRKNCQRFGEHMNKTDMPLSFCAGFSEKEDHLH